MSDAALDAARSALATVKDPCLVAAGFDLSIVDLGLIHDITQADGKVRVDITFTEPGCPFTHHVVTAIETALKQAGIAEVAVRPVWDPIWTEEKLLPEARRQFVEARRCLGRVNAKMAVTEPTE